MKTATEHSPVPPLVGLAFGILAVSTASIFIRFAQEEAPSLVIAAYRLTVAALILAPIALTRHRREILHLSRKELVLALASGFFLALHFATWITSLEYTTVASSVVLVTTTSLWVALLSPFTLKEPIARFVLVGMVIALIGGIIIGLSDTCRFNGFQLSCLSVKDWASGTAFWGDILAVTGAIMAACYIIIGRRLRVKMSLVSYIFLVYSMAAIVLVIFVAIAGYQPFAYSPKIYLWFILLAVFPQLIGHSTFNWALKYVSAAYVSIALLGEPIGSSILAFLILNESPGGLKIFGAILILAGIYMASRSEKDR